MKSHWRKLLSILPAGIEKKFYEKYFRDEHKQWELNGRKLPVSNLIKQEALRQIQKKYTIKTLVETGTYLGDTLYSVSSDFETLYSIELSDFYYQLAQKRFKKIPQVHLLKGDSGKVLKELVPKLNSVALFWLDGHYSGGLTAKGDKECPVYEELNAIFTSPYNHIIFIDDSRHFVGANDYPTIEELKNYVSKHKPNYSFSIENDCIRLIPSSVK